MRSEGEALRHAARIVVPSPYIGGILARDLAARIQASGVADRIALEGERDDAVVEAAMAEATVFALATPYEGYGLVFGEAMRWGLSIASCRAGAVPGTVGAAGHLVPPDDAGAFAAALRALLTDRRALAALAAASARAGAALPRWRDTAAIVAGAVEAAARDR